MIIHTGIKASLQKTGVQRNDTHGHRTSQLGLIGGLVPWNKNSPHLLRNTYTKPIFNLPFCKILLCNAKMKFTAFSPRCPLYNANLPR